MNQSEQSSHSEARLNSVYEEVMWLARRPNTTPSDARSWYTHVAAVKLRRHVCRFSGKVSHQALEPEAVLRLEHFKRLQITLTQLVDAHIREGICDPREFFRVVSECEQVHIVTNQENYAAMKAGGDYAKAGIMLVDWQEIAPGNQRRLWNQVLRGRVSNAQDFEPDSGAS